MTVNGMMTSLMDKARKLTGLTDKISIAQLDNLMSNFVSPNLIADTSDNWQDVNPTWNVSVCDALPAIKGDTISASVEVKNCTGKISLVAVYLDKDKKPLVPWMSQYDSNGNAPLSTGNISANYITDDKGFSADSSLRKMTLTIEANNCKYLQLLIAEFDGGASFSFRKPMAVKGPQPLPWTPEYIVGEGS